MDGPMNREELRLRLDADIERAQASVDFWRTQVHLQTDGPFDMTVVQALQAHKSNANELLTARRFLDNA